MEIKNNTEGRFRTTLPEKITSVEEAKKYLTELAKNGEVYHPDDNAADIIWVTIPTDEQCQKMDELMSQIGDLDFDPYEFILNLPEINSENQDISKKCIEDMETWEITSYLKDNRNVAFILWQVADVEIKALRDYEVILPTEYLEEIISDLNNSADCEYGITWDHLDDSIRTTVNEITIEVLKTFMSFVLNLRLKNLNKK